jgi:hypothetical protein
MSLETQIGILRARFSVRLPALAWRRSALSDLRKPVASHGEIRAGALLLCWAARSQVTCWEGSAAPAAARRGSAEAIGHRSLRPRESSKPAAA